MANRAYLLLHDYPEPVLHNTTGVSIALAASYSMPVFWISAFSLDCVKSISVPVVNDRGDESSAKVPTLHSDISTAVMRSEAKREFLLNYLPSALLPQYQEWLTLLKNATKRYLQMDIAELWMMAEPQEFEKTLNKCLNAFDRRHAAEVDLLFCQANLDLDGQRKIKYYDKTDVYGLIGYKW